MVGGVARADSSIRHNDSQRALSRPCTSFRRGDTTERTQRFTGESPGKEPPQKGVVQWLPRRRLRRRRSQRSPPRRPRRRSSSSALRSTQGSWHLPAPLCVCGIVESRSCPWPATTARHAMNGTPRTTPTKRPPAEFIRRWPPVVRFSRRWSQLRSAPALRCHRLRRFRGLRYRDRTPDVCRESRRIFRARPARNDDAEWLLLADVRLTNLLHAYVPAGGITAEERQGSMLHMEVH